MRRPSSRPTSPSIHSSPSALDSLTTIIERHERARTPASSTFSAQGLNACFQKLYARFSATRESPTPSTSHGSSSADRGAGLWPSFSVPAGLSDILKFPEPLVFYPAPSASARRSRPRSATTTGRRVIILGHDEKYPYEHKDFSPGRPPAQTQSRTHPRRGTGTVRWRDEVQPELGLEVVDIPPSHHAHFHSHSHAHSSETSSLHQADRRRRARAWSSPGNGERDAYPLTPPPPTTRSLRSGRGAAVGHGRDEELEDGRERLPRWKV